MNPSLQRYVEFRQMMVRQARAQRADSRAHAVGDGAGARQARERAMIERSALLEQAAEQAAAMRWTLRAVRRHGSHQIGHHGGATA
jgi:hypothetical protein